MTKLFLAIGAATVALSAVPAGARNYSDVTKCAKWRNDRCVQWNVLTRGQAVATPNIASATNSARAIFTWRPVRFRSDRHPLPSRTEFRYVNDNGYVYVVNPLT